ncbi:MAG: tryptophan--tRNA ligase [Candidatus Pacebacteria bacterium]|nr:tryptophan--tRNA ligase [Candidatus Paceibacterota bacterium]
MFGFSSHDTPSKKILLSGIQATGKLHFGNYFGAMRQNISLGNSGEYEAYIFIADYHSLTTVKDKNALRQSALEIAAAYIACGLDTSRVTLFRQSAVPEHTELAMIFNNVVTMPYLMRAHAFKNHEAKNQEVNVGLFDYPVLMAADILMYQADVVPVGSDQKQHVEYARDIAGFYNRAWNVEQFKLPKEMILESVATIPGVDGAKMSKSKGNVISLFGTDEEVKKAVMGIVTDSARPEETKNADENTIFNIHKHFLSDEEVSILRARFEQGGYGYKEAKEDLLATIIKWREGKKEKFDELMAHPEKIEKMLEDGGKRARAKAQETMKQVREQIGL